MVLYGPLVTELGDPASFDERSLWSSLYGHPSSGRVTFGKRDVLRAGRGSGRVIGGCLSLLVSLLGTRFDPDYGEAILFWEEIGEEPYRLDRMLTQLRNAGKFDRLRGMIIGSLTRCDAPPGKTSLRVPEILHDLTREASFPIVRNVRAGHIARKITLPLGVEGTLDTVRGCLTLRLPPSGSGRLALRRHRGRRG